MSIAAVTEAERVADVTADAIQVAMAIGADPTIVASEDPPFDSATAADNYTITATNTRFAGTKVTVSGC